MSQENVEVVRRMFERYEAGDVTLSDYAEDTEWLPDASMFPETEPVRGRDAIRSWIQDVSSAFESPETSSGSRTPSALMDRPIAGTRVYGNHGSDG